MNQAVGISVLPSLSGTARAKRIFSQIFFSLPNQFATSLAGRPSLLLPHIRGPSGCTRTQLLPCGGRLTPRSRVAVMTMAREERAIP